MPRLQRLLEPASLISLGAIAIVAFYVWGLSALYGVDPGWMVDGSGHFRTNEYVGVRAAGELALEGHAADAYDWAKHTARLAQITGQPVVHYFAWPYPPPYLFVAMLLAAFPLMPAALLWIALTGTLYAWSVARIAKVRAAALWAIGSPATLVNAFVAHTGFWTAGVLGLGLELLETRPVMAGVLFGLLTLKPQLGLLLPVALIAGGYWRTIGAASGTAAALATASLLAFGSGPWLEFLPQMERTTAWVRDGHVIVELMISPYGCLRSLGLGHGASLAGQAVASLLLVIAVYRLWRSEAQMALKAAGLASASVLVSPYGFIYDLTNLSVAIAFLVRHVGLARLRPAEVGLLIAAVLMMIGVAILPLPLAFLSNAIVAAVVFQHVRPYLGFPAAGAVSSLTLKA